MDALPILLYPHPNLRKKARSVDEVTPEITEFAETMLHTMYAANGIGLAAIQVDRPLRIIVIDVSEQKNAPQVFINPSITVVSGSQMLEEGCLSVPGFFEAVKRADLIKVDALDRHGKPFTKQASGIESVCIQHEVDHLDGKMFVDYLSRLKEARIRKKLIKSREAA